MRLKSWITIRLNHLTIRPAAGRLAWFTGLMLAVVLVGVLLPACTPSPTSILAPTLTHTIPTATEAGSPTITATLPPSATPQPTATPTPSSTPTLTRTPPELPATFQTNLINAKSFPVSYIQDTCQYLKARWDPNNSPPGTVAMIIMYHSITEDSAVLFPDGSQIHHSELVKTLERAHELGFETITASQLAGFLYDNARIPARSLLIIVDDRKRKQYYETHFVPHLEEYHWTITNAWISAADTPEYLWKENQEIQAAGWVDPQAHGVVHNIPIGEHSTDEYILTELQGSQEAIEAYFGKKPVGFIWPGGGFTRRAVELAKQVGYLLGFTTNPRGPVMFNWIPQADRADDSHPLWLPEIPAGDPLMTLPRYWSSDAAYRLDDVVQIGDQAAADAAVNRSIELDYYDIVCKPVMGEIPAFLSGN